MKHLKSKKAMIPVLVLVGAVMLSVFGTRDKTEFYGEVEAISVSHSAEVSGKIVESDISLGQQVKEGQVLAVIDDSNQKYAIEQLELNLAKAQIYASDSKRGNGGVADNNYAAAKAAYDSAAVLSEKAKKDYDKAQKLYDESVSTGNELDSAKVAYDTSLNVLKEAKARLGNISSNSSGNTADIDIQMIESQLRQQKDNLKKYEIKAACDGTVMSKNYGKGDFVGMGYNIADISSAKERYVVVYFPSERLGEIEYDQDVLIVAEESSVEGKVKFIDVKAQYTPKDMQTPANRNQEAVQVKILIPEEFEANVGQKVKVRFHE